MPKLKPIRQTADKYARVLANRIDHMFVSRADDVAGMISNHIQAAIKEDRAEQRRFQRQKDRVLADAKERAALWATR